MTPSASPKQILVWGIAWALGQWIVEGLAFSPPRNLATPTLLLWWFFYGAIPLWCVAGCALTWLAERSQHWDGRYRLLAGLVVVTLVTSILQPPLTWLILSAAVHVLPTARRIAEQVYPPPPPSQWLDNSLYDVWIGLCYGGLLLVLYRLAARTQRVRALLAKSAITRARMERLIDEERLHTLQRQIDPTLLLDTMRELEEHYRSDPVRAEHLLETLVEFLRCAMQGLRSPTAAADPRLAEAHARLQRARFMSHISQENIHAH